MYDTIQYILTISIDAIALSYSALIFANFVLRLVELWGKSKPKVNPGICAATIAPIFAPIFAEVDELFNLPDFEALERLKGLEQELAALKEKYQNTPSCPNQTSADILNTDTTPETVAEAATTRSTSPKQKKQRTLPTSGQKKQSSVKPNTKQQKKPRNASASGPEKNTLLKNKA